MHQKVGHRWTVESLAAACGMSRSAFLRFRFKGLGWGNTAGIFDRLENAESNRIAARKVIRSSSKWQKSVGYDSDTPPFSKAFKRVFGCRAQGISTKYQPGILNFTDELQWRLTGPLRVGSTPRGIGGRRNWFIYVGRFLIPLMTSTSAGKLIPRSVEYPRSDSSA